MQGIALVWFFRCCLVGPASRLREACLCRERGATQTIGMAGRGQAGVALVQAIGPIPWSTEKASKLASQPEVFLPCVQPSLCHQSHCPKTPSDHVRTSKISHSPVPWHLRVFTDGEICCLFPYEPSDSAACH